MANEKKLVPVDALSPEEVEQRTLRFVEEQREERKKRFKWVEEEQKLRFPNLPPLHYDKQGKPMSLLDYSEKFGDMEYRRIAEDELPGGKWVSTVWMGLDHNFQRNGPPLIFETMVFAHRNGGRSGLDTRRYATEAEAREGHQKMVEEWRYKLVLIPGGEDVE